MQSELLRMMFDVEMIVDRVRSLHRLAFVIISVSFSLALVSIWSDDVD